jgi:hypothetical protein
MSEPGSPESIAVYIKAYWSGGGRRAGWEREMLKDLEGLQALAKDATRYRKIKAISQRHMGIDIFENDGVVDVFHTGLDAGHKAPTFDQAIDEVAE